ncbi:hypothetical protein BpHYR1_028556 [Brachionus plicatilis]|uniref:Uncharacterized protein n=1 Tax=Brachionus plicatilis TaxID=10195 RepID=A0A3M7RUT9_BRAPC|nr:hypothetical protein BpHYR1_028556 [Brachionus plicatilis]
MPKKVSPKCRSNVKPKTSKYKIMTRNEYEALKVQLNVFREDYRLEFYEKMHMKDFYEQKIKKIEYLNTKLSRELDRFKLNEINDPFEGSTLNIAQHLGVFVINLLKFVDEFFQLDLHIVSDRIKRTKNN